MWKDYALSCYASLIQQLRAITNVEKYVEKYENIL